MDPSALVVVGIVWLMCAGLGTYVAGQKGRSPGEGFVLGLLFGPIGALIVAVLPTKQSEPDADGRRAGESTAQRCSGSVTSGGGFGRGGEAMGKAIDELYKASKLDRH